MKSDKYQHMSDQELLEQFYQDHDNEWLGHLLQRYTLLLLGVSMKYLKNEEEAKDSVQQIFFESDPGIAEIQSGIFLNPGCTWLPKTIA